MKVLKLASCMAENTESFCQQVADYICERLAIKTEYVAGIPWQEKERLFDEGEIEILWLCGLPYITKAAMSDSGMELLVVPVPKGPRYHGRPVYFSDVVVRRESSYRGFDDLRGASWVYNEPGSHSGYNVTRAYLAEFGETSGFFGNVVESGSHTISLEMVLNSEVDAAAIDSTVLEWVISQWPETAKQLRVIETLGPSPMPPWVISMKVAKRSREALRALFLHMHEDTYGRFVLARGALARFVFLRDEDYDPIRRMAHAGEGVILGQRLSDD